MVKQEEEIKGIKTGKEKVKFSLVAVGMFLDLKENNDKGPMNT
jgi:hypothetical protein